MEVLRRSEVLVISLVAESKGVIIGHLAISPISISDGAADWFGPGRISVLPEYQGQGVGTELMKNALAGLKAKGAAGCVVLTDPGYYERFGFKAVEGLVFTGGLVEYFQLLSFGGGFPRGEVAYHEAFSA